MGIRGLLLTALLLTASVLDISAYNDLKIIDPMNPWWNYYPSFIEDVELTIHPKGTFFEVGMYMTFSTLKNEFDSSLQLEAIYNFDLPANAMITDSWLWIEGEPEKALILDRWTASAIYEGIVERRKDPSILTKTGATSYELRVYPLTGAMPRKVKINYLVPASWSTSSVSLPLPINQLQVGDLPPQSATIYVKTDNTWTDPYIRSDSVSGFTAYSGEYDANFYTTVPIISNLGNLEFDSPMKDGLFVNQYGVNGEGYYQLALLPSARLEIDKAKKICFLVDYKGSSGDLADIMESTIRNHMNSRDSFNIMVSGIEIVKAGNDWLPANDTTITNAFELLDDLTNSYSVLPTLIAEGMKFTKDEGALIIVSDNYDIRTNKQANQLIEDLGTYKPWPVIHVFDMNNYNYSIWMGGRYFYGNEYLYSLLTRQTNGNYVSLRNGKGVAQNLEELTQSASGFISSFDLYSTLANGFCFSRFNSGMTGSTAYLNRPIIQVGRYNGNFPFKLMLSGVYNDESFSQEIEVPAEDIEKGDTTTRQIWSGMYIRSLEQSPAGNEIIGEIINESLVNRILTIYTAFLTLEPGMIIPEPGEEEFTDVVISGTEDVSSEINALSMSGFPNPFTSEITLELEIPESEINQNASLQVYNTTGQLVKIFNLEEYGNEGRITIRWDGKDGSGEDIEPGIYIVRYTSENSTKTLRIVKI